MASILYSQQFFMLKCGRSYFGHGGSTIGRPLVFTFTKQHHADIVRKTLTLWDCNIHDYNQSVYELHVAGKVNVNAPRLDMSIDSYGFFDAQIYLTMNNVDMFIVDSIIEDDDGHIYLVNSPATFQPLFINNDMTVMHMNRLLNMDDVVSHPID